MNGTTIVAKQGSANQGGVVASARTWNELGAWRFAVDGKPAATLGLGGVRNLLYGAAGTNLPVELGGVTPCQVTLTLRDYI